MDELAINGAHDVYETLYAAMVKAGEDRNHADRRATTMTQNTIVSALFSDLQYRLAEQPFMDDRRREIGFRLAPRMTLSPAPAQFFCRVEAMGAFSDESRAAADRHLESLLLEVSAAPKFNRHLKVETKRLLNHI